MIPLPPTPTLLPYTTLFRSGVRGVAPDVKDVELLRRPVLRSRELDLARDGGESVDHEDRKSTRLNSSHLVNSYAVSCLNKETRRPGVRHHSSVALRTKTSTW